MVTACLEFLLKVSVQAAALAAVVWLVTRLARKAPAGWRNALWLVVLIKFLVPPFAYYPSELAFWHASVRHVATTTASGANQPSLPVLPPQAVSAPRPAAGPTPVLLSEPPRTSVASALPVREMIALVWLVGVVTMLSIIAVRFARQVRLVRESAPAGPGLSDVLHAAGERLGLRRLPDLRVSPDARTPMLIGLFRPAILLPRGITDNCGGGDLRAMLLHELAHVKRRDMAAMWLQQVAQALFYFHPAVWLAGREIKRERELACDELVLSKSAIPARDYAAGYVSALKLANGLPACSTSLAMAEPFDMEKRRLNMILKSAVPKLSARWIVALALIAAVGLVTFVGVAPKKTYSARQLLMLATKARAKALADVKSGKGRLIFSSRTSECRQPTFHYNVAFTGEKFTLSFLQRRGGYEEKFFCDGHSMWVTVNGRRQRGWGFDADSPGWKGRVDRFRRIHALNMVDQAYPGGMLSRRTSAPRVAGRETIDGSECIIVEYGLPMMGHPGVERLWIDPNRGYASPKRQLWQDTGALKKKTLWFEANVRLKQYKGIWLPATYAQYSLGWYRTKTGKHYTHCRELVRYSPDFAINVAVTDKDLGLPPTSGKVPAKETSQSGELLNAKMLAGLTAVRGPGIVVTLGDSPKLDPKEKRRDVIEQYQVHDFDIRNVVNELFSAGAEAVCVGGQRIVATSAIRAAGAGILVNSARIAVPTEIRAIGPASTLQAVLQNRGGAAEGLFLLDMIKTEKCASITVPAYKGRTQFRLAHGI